ncbi:PREDICTED: hydroxysteroid dehydrogenase-like protein 1 [Amphimedon queenslandica]|uniref:Uncharacterized protein n=1 Tax=Amphimedon queenslandica TaxID=400682 RepID=A0AAN0JPD3_AMPQE|nr:PREDICTED: hydroxysteroid dehydrogenase-like protein 1 [Amphimedon queenslandica]|eukprot:XP_019858660.1 PREDICTED: hydroxysteroid dehydrogenase-like protein 1 [Amphimedon queenslandica]
MMTHMILPTMLERGRGAIINVSSALGDAPPTPLLAAEAASMSFVTMLGRTLHDEYHHKGITVQTLTPLPLSKDNSFVSPSPEVYVRHALRTLDYRSNCCGYWIHAIINYVYQLVPARLWVWFMSHRNQRVRERQLTVGARERGGVTFSKNRSTVSFAISTTPPDEVYTASEAGQRPELIRNYSRVAVMPSVAEQESNK